MDFLLRPVERGVCFGCVGAGQELRGLYLGLDRAAQAKLAVPQDAVFRLDAGEATRIDAAPAALVTDGPER